MILSRYSLFIRLYCLAFLLLLAHSSYGNEWFTNNQIHGFASQGWTKTTSNHFFGDSDSNRGSFDFTEVGITGSTQVYQNVRASAQVLFRRAGNLYPHELRINFAHIDWDFMKTANSTTTLRIGRLKNPFGLYNDTRDVAFTRPSIFLPQTIYFDRVRNAILANDGFNINYRHNSQYGNFDIVAGAGFLDIDHNVRDTFIGTFAKGELDANRPVVLGRIQYETPDSALRLSFSNSYYQFDYTRSPNDMLQSGTVNAHYWIASAQYNTELWSITGEYMNEPVTRQGFDFDPLDDLDHTVEGWYLQADLRPVQNLQLYLRYEEGYLDKNKRNPSSYPDNFRSDAYQKTTVIGARWDINQSWMLRTEYHLAKGTFILSGLDNPDRGDLVENWNMFSIEAAFRF